MSSNSAEILKPIVCDDDSSALNLTNGIDDFYTKLILDDYDWMNYVLLCVLPSKDYGDIKIVFNFSGYVKSIMIVKTVNKIHGFEFNSDIFKKHIIMFLQKHIQRWDSEQAFSGLKEVINFYNDVLQSSKKVTKNEYSRVIRLLKDEHNIQL